MHSVTALYALGKYALQCYARFFLDLRIEQETILPTGAKILAANHPSTLDPLLMPLFIRQQVHMFIGGDYFHLPVLGYYLRHTDHIAVIKGERDRILHQAQQLLEKGATVGIFPEGTLSASDGSLAPLKTGVARLALATGAPVIPIGIALDEKHTHNKHIRIQQHQEIIRWYFRGPYCVTLGKPLFFTGTPHSKEDCEGALATISLAIATMQQKSKQKVFKTKQT